MKINSYNDVEKLAEMLKEKDVVIDLEDCKDRIRVLDFISGITFYNGSVKKLTKDTFEVSLKR